MQHPFKLKNAALLMALAAVYPLTVHSAAGVAQFTVGDVNVRRGNAAVPLTKGQPIVLLQANVERAALAVPVGLISVSATTAPAHSTESGSHAPVTSAPEFSPNSPHGTPSTFGVTHHAAAA